jgi:uncharacterized cofD-like protein
MHGKNVVVLGGGPGTDIALMGLKRYTARLTALISTFDRGTRTGMRHGNGAAGNGHGAGNGHAYNDQPADEVRSSLLALGADADTTSIMARLFDYRSARWAGLEEYTFGNLFLSALTEITGGADLALQAASQVLKVQGRVLPVTLDECGLVAELNDGTMADVATPTKLVEAASQVGLRRVLLAQPTAALDAALQAILDAEIIVLGPADFYFNILGPLQLEGVSDALMQSKAVKIFICNMMTQPHTTNDWPASRFIRSVQGYMGGPGSLDCVIVNSAPLSPDALSAQARAGSLPVRFDLDECLSLGLNVIMRPVAASQSLLFDPEKLARTILFLGGGRSVGRAEKRGLFPTGPLAGVVPPNALAPGMAET